MPEIETAALGNEAGMIGAASLLYVKYGGDKMRINPDNKKYVIAEGSTGEIQKNRFGSIHVHQQSLNSQENT